MTLLESMRELLDDPYQSVIRECRDCGTTLEAKERACPACGSNDIARYDLQ